MTDGDVYTSERPEQEIRELGHAFRDLFGFGNQVCPDIVHALENELPRYLPQFALVPVRDGSLGAGRAANASYNPHRIEIENSKSSSSANPSPGSICHMS
jgi:hypothetical protein